MSKKIVIYCGVDNKHSAGYIKISESYRNLSSQQKIDLLTDLIDELTFEKNFVNNLDNASNFE